MPSSNNATRPATEEGYSLNIKLRSSCVAHLLQLVIKDGLSALKVLSFYKSADYFVPGFQFLFLIVILLDWRSFCRKESREDRVIHQKKRARHTKTVAKAVGFHLPNKNSTRWNSQYLMIKRLVEAFEKLPLCKTH